MVSRIRIGPEGGPFVEIDEDNGTLKLDAPSGDIDLQANDLLSLGDLDLTGNQLQNAVLLGATLGGALNADGQDIENIATVRSDDIENDQTVTTNSLSSTNINNADTVTTQDLVVNGTATGPFGGGAPVLESGDTITVVNAKFNTADESFVDIYNGVAKDVLCGTINARFQPDFLYEFSDNQTITCNGGVGVTTYSLGTIGGGEAQGDTIYETASLPPAKDVIRVAVGHVSSGGQRFGAEVIFKD